MRYKLLTKINQSELQIFDYLAVDFLIKMQKIKSVSSNYNSFSLHFFINFRKRENILFYCSYKLK